MALIDLDSGCLRRPGQESCSQLKHVLLRHKKKVMFVLLFPWTLVLGGLAVLVELVAHMFGCHIGFGGF